MKKTSFIELQSKKSQLLPPLLDVKVTMENRVTNEAPIEQLIQKLDISQCMNDAANSIVFSKLLSLLYLNYNIPTDNKQIYYFANEAEIFVNCGVTPISDEVKIEMTDIDTQKFLHVKLKNIGLLHSARLMLTQNVVSNAEGANEDSGDEDEKRTGKKRCRRTKERRIGHVIEKVIEWRKFYSGTSDEAYQHQKFSLEEAAKKVGISKKSLDDYLFQIRLGHRFGFNFNEHYNQKVGILRDYVRQQKKTTSKGEQKQRKRKTKQMQSDQ